MLLLFPVSLFSLFCLHKGLLASGLRTECIAKGVLDKSKNFSPRIEGDERKANWEHAASQGFMLAFSALLLGPGGCAFGCCLWNFRQGRIGHVFFCVFLLSVIIFNHLRQLSRLQCAIYLVIWKPIISVIGIQHRVAFITRVVVCRVGGAVPFRHFPRLSKHLFPVPFLCLAFCCIL